MRKNGKKAKLLYRGTRDGGWKGNDFHTLCDDKGATVTLFLSNNSIACGGFTSVSWDSKSGDKKDNKSFVFSLDKQLIYPV